MISDLKDRRVSYIKKKITRKMSNEIKDGFRGRSKSTKKCKSLSAERPKKEK